MLRKGKLKMWETMVDDTDMAEAIVASTKQAQTTWMLGEVKPCATTLCCVNPLSQKVFTNAHVRSWI